MSITLVNQTAAKTTSGGSSTKSITIPTPTSGNALILVMYTAAAGSTLSSFSGGGVTWNLGIIQADTNGTREVRVYYGVNSSGSGSTVSFTTNLTYMTYECNISEWSGLDNTPTLDPSATGNTGRSITVASASVAPTAGKSVLLIAAGCSQGTVTNSPTGSFTALSRSGTATLGAFAYQIVSSASGSYQTTWANQHSYNYWASLIIGFDAAAGGGGGGTVPTPYYRLLAGMGNL